MMSLLLYFIVAFAISALSSLPAGLITLTVAQRAIEAGKRAGYRLSLGATLTEYIYTHIALVGLPFLSESITVNYYLQIIATIIFFAFGSYNLLKKPKSVDQPKKQYNSLDFISGLIVAAMNVLVIPFWIFIALWLSDYGYTFEANGPIIAFSLGSALGAMVIFFLYAELGHFIMRRIGKVVQYTDKMIGVALIVLGFYQLVSLFYLV